MATTYNPTAITITPSPGTRETQHRRELTERHRTEEAAAEEPRVEDGRSIAENAACVAASNDGVASASMSNRTAAHPAVPPAASRSANSRGR